MIITNRNRAANEIKALFMDSRPWRLLAMADIRSKYRRTAIGPFWITISMAATALAIGVIYGQFFGQDMRTYLPFLTAGLILWNFMAGTISESATVLISSSAVIKATNLPICFHNMRMVQRNLIVFLHNLVVLGLIWPFARWPVSFEILLFVPAVVLLYVFLASISVIISLICIRYRDVPPMITAAVQFLFLASPVIWYPESLRFGTLLLHANPIHYFLAITRDPLLGRPLDPVNWLAACSLAALSLLLAVLLYRRYRNRVAFWV